MYCKLQYKYIKNYRLFCFNSRIGWQGLSEPCFLQSYACAWCHTKPAAWIKIKHPKFIRMSYSLVIHRRVELRTPWLKVMCSTYWANGALLINSSIILSYKDFFVNRFSENYWNLCLSEKNQYQLVKYCISL